MNIMIAGGSGLIGRALTRVLVDQGHFVFILSREPNVHTEWGKAVNFIEWDGKTTKGWGSYVNEVDAIVNLAGTPLNGNGPLDIWLTKKRRENLLSSRLNTTKALLDGVREAGKRPSVFVQASAIGYYGPRGSEKVFEDDEPGDDYLAGVQVKAEKSSEDATKLGMRRIVIRTGLVLDKDEGAFQYFKFQFALFAGGRMGSGEQYYSWIHVTDEAEAIRFLVEQKNANGVYNLTAPHPVTNREFARALGKAMRRPSFFVIPKFLLRLVLGEIATVVVDGQRVIPDRLQKAGFEFQYTQLKDALKDVV